MHQSMWGGDQTMLISTCPHRSLANSHMVPLYKLIVTLQLYMYIFSGNCLSDVSVSNVSQFPLWWQMSLYLSLVPRLSPQKKITWEYAFLTRMTMYRKVDFMVCVQAQMQFLYITFTTNGGALPCKLCILQWPRRTICRSSQCHARPLVKAAKGRIYIKASVGSFRSIL